MSENLKALAYKLRIDTIDIIMAGGGGTRLWPWSRRGQTKQMLRITGERSMFQITIDRIRNGYSATIANKMAIGHPHNTLPGIEMNSGSLGHGLPVAVGLALAAKKRGKDNRVYVVTGDGELAEGSNWEGFMSGAMFGLDNLCCIIDRNRLQISGCTEDVMALDDLKAKVTAFGWNVISLKDGNDIDEIDAAFEQAKTVKGKPTCIIANTVKGKGSEVMENKAGWHHKVPSEEQYQQIMKDLKEKKEALLA